MHDEKTVGSEPIAKRLVNISNWVAQKRGGALQMLGSDAHVCKERADFMAKIRVTVASDDFEGGFRYGRKRRVSQRVAIALGKIL